MMPRNKQEFYLDSSERCQSSSHLLVPSMLYPWIPWIPYCDKTSLVTIAGLLKRGSVPALVFGKAITSRIDCVLQRMDISRSNPECRVNVLDSIGGDVYTHRARFHHVGERHT